MNKAAFEETKTRLDAAGLSTTGWYDAEVFGSWFVEVATAPPLRVLWEGRDGWLLVQLQTSEVFAGMPVWRDLWVAKEPAEQDPAKATALVTTVAKRGFDPRVGHTPRKDVVATGSWLYDGIVGQPVYIVRLDYDFWFELAKEEEQLEPGEEPNLDENGYAYYVSWHGIDPDGSFWPDSGGYPTLEEAKAEAERRVPSTVAWE